MASGEFINWGAIVTSVITLVVSVAASVGVSLYIQPRIARRNRLQEKREAPTMCPGCRHEVPAWFILRPGSTCRICQSMALRYPLDDDTPEKMDREWKTLNARIVKHVKKLAAKAKKPQLPPPSTPES